LVGRVNGERLLAGSNMHETLLKSPRTGSYIFIPGNLTTEEHVKQYIYSNFPYLPETVYPMIQHFYPPPEKSGGRYDDMTGRIAAISGEAVLNCPSYWLVQAFPAGKAYHYEWQSCPRQLNGPNDYSSPCSPCARLDCYLPRRFPVSASSITPASTLRPSTRILHHLQGRSKSTPTGNGWGNRSGLASVLTRRDTSSTHGEGPGDLGGK